MNDFSKKSDKDGHSGRRWIQNYYSTESSYSRWLSLLWSCTCICVHIKQHPKKNYLEKQTDKWKKRWPEIVRGAHTAGVAARSGWFALPPALSTPVALESIQLQPPPVKTVLTFFSTRSCRIWTLKGLWSSTWHHSRCFLLLCLVELLERFNYHSAQCLEFLHLDILLIQTCILTKRIRAVQWEASCILFWTVQVHSLPLRQGWKHTKSCSRPPVITLHKLIHVTPPTLLFLAASIKLITLALAHKTMILVIQELELILLLHQNKKTTLSCSEQEHQLNDCNENVTLETSGCLLQPPLLSPKKIKWFILFKTANIKSCPSAWRQLAKVNISPYLSHISSDEAKGKEKEADIVFSVFWSWHSLPHSAPLGI